MPDHKTLTIAPRNMALRARSAALRELVSRRILALEAKLREVGVTL